MSDDRSLKVERVINARPKKVFQALTDPEILERWFYAGEGDGWSATVDAEIKEEGSFRIDMHGEKDTYSHTGIYREIIPNQKIVFTWNSKAVHNTVVTITLQEIDHGTKVILVHEFLPNQQMVDNHTKGWETILKRLEALFDGVA